LQIDWLSTLSPCTKSDKSLEQKNLLLSSLNEKNYRFHFFNEENEIPINSVYKKYLTSYKSDNKHNRPKLKDYLIEGLSEWVIVSNSDIILISDLKETIKKLDKLDAGFASLRRFDIEDFSLLDSFYKKEKNLKFFLNRFCKLQSKRTLDFFLIRRDILKVLLIIDEFDLTPGTVGFDINLIFLANKITKVADISGLCHLIHRNHETFRIPHKLNFILSIDENNSFSTERTIMSKKNSNPGCLSYADFTLDKKREIVNPRSLKKIKYKVESLRIRLVNNLEILAYRYNELIFYCNKFLFRTMNFRLHSFFGALILIPDLKEEEKNNRIESSNLKSYLLSKYSIYKKNR